MIDLETPALLLYRDVVERNLTHMAARVIFRSMRGFLFRLCRIERIRRVEVSGRQID